MALAGGNESLKFMASPWSAPAWMKQTGHMIGGGPLKGELNGEYYKTWASYFIRLFIILFIIN
jgi:glucosylceramidase